MKPLEPVIYPDNARLNEAIADCDRCPRLVEWRESVAEKKVKRFADEVYWGKGVPGFGDPNGRLLIIGLAPAAHGANRTGRMFTGDNSGLWLYRALHRAGFANQPTSEHREDGLALKDCYITAMVHCAPPDNKPTPDEIDACRPFLVHDFHHFLPHVRVILCLGSLAFQQSYKILKARFGFQTEDGRTPKFGHLAAYTLTAPTHPWPILLLASYHPSQQNTFTGKLTEPMFDAVFQRASAEIMS